MKKIAMGLFLSTIVFGLFASPEKTGISPFISSGVMANKQQGYLLPDLSTAGEATTMYATILTGMEFDMYYGIGVKVGVEGHIPLSITADSTRLEGIKSFFSGQTELYYKHAIGKKWDIMVGLGMRAIIIPIKNVDVIVDGNKTITTTYGDFNVIIPYAETEISYAITDNVSVGLGCSVGMITPSALNSYIKTEQDGNTILTTETKQIDQSGISYIPNLTIKYRF